MAWYEGKKGGGGELAETELWSNQSPASAFSAQTVTLSQSIDDFKYIKVYANISTSDTTEGCVIYEVDKFKTMNADRYTQIGDITLKANGTTAGYSHIRSFVYISSNQVQFGNAWAWTNSSSATNTYTIPTKICGLK